MKSLRCPSAAFWPPSPSDFSAGGAKLIRDHGLWVCVGGQTRLRNPTPHTDEMQSKTVELLGYNHWIGKIVVKDQHGHVGGTFKDVQKLG